MVSFFTFHNFLFIHKSHATECEQRLYTVCNQVCMRIMYVGPMGAGSSLRSALHYTIANTTVWHRTRAS